MTTIVRSRIDDVEARLAETILNELGMNMSEYIRFSVRSLNAKKGLPFDMVITNPETLKAIDDMNNRRDIVTFQSIDELKSHFKGK